MNSLRAPQTIIRAVGAARCMHNQCRSLMRLEWSIQESGRGLAQQILPSHATGMRGSATWMAIQRAHKQDQAEKFSSIQTAMTTTEAGNGCSGMI